jgi:hypothetical protein
MQILKKLKHLFEEFSDELSFNILIIPEFFHFPKLSHSKFDLIVQGLLHVIHQEIGSLFVLKGLHYYIWRRLDCLEGDILSWFEGHFLEGGISYDHLIFFNGDLLEVDLRIVILCGAVIGYLFTSFKASVECKVGCSQYDLFFYYFVGILSLVAHILVWGSNWYLLYISVLPNCLQEVVRIASDHVGPQKSIKL